MSAARELLEAGAVLPAGTEDAGEDAVPLTARTYRHPALDGRVVVRLVAAELGQGEDQAAGFLGLEPAADPRIVGVGQRTVLGFPEWVLVHHPEDGHHALAVVPEMERIAKRAKTKPKAALDAFHELAGRLASSVPHLLPTFYERVAREYLAAENLACATQMFTRARNAEAEHGLEIDEERHDAVFLEFALAGALQVKTLSGYARELSARVPAAEALRRFTRLCVRRTAGGVPPSAQMATDLRRLAKESGEEAAAVEEAYLAEVLALPATARAGTGWWKAHHKALVALARERPDVKGLLLDITPADSDENLPALWLELLEESGATAALCDPESEPEEARPEDGSAGWLKRVLGFWEQTWRGSPEPPLHSLVERMADRLKAELAEKGFEPVPHVDLLDLLLSLGVPVADPKPAHELRLDAWAVGEDRRDLLALAADPRFHDAFHRAVGQVGVHQRDLNVFRALIDSPGGRPLLSDWVEAVARQTATSGLPAMPDALGRLERLPGDVLALAEDAVREVADVDLAPLLARTLRAGIFDELGWPAWEKAVSELEKYPADVVVADSWPYLVVAGRTQARVIDAEGTVLTHDLRIPRGDMRGLPGFHYVDGELFVRWRTNGRNSRALGYWHTAPDRQEPVSGSFAAAEHLRWYRQWDHSLPLPGGGRTTGGGVLHRGDTRLPAARNVIGDGTSYWVWLTREREEGPGWYEYDPASGKCGQRRPPAFFADAARGLPDGSAFASGRLLPVPSEEATPVGTPVDGVLGWRVVRLPDGSLRGEDLSGNSIVTPEGHFPSFPLFLPGDDRPRALVHGYHRIELVDPDGVVTAGTQSAWDPGAFSPATPCLPPLNYWHCMRPRDERGSRALRRIGGETAAALIEEARGDGDILEAVRGLIPEVTDERLLKGIGGVARYAAAQQSALKATAARLEKTLARRVAEKGKGPSDELLLEGLQGLGHSGSAAFKAKEPSFFTGLRIMARAMAADGRGGQEPPGFHWDGVKLPSSGLPVEAMGSGHAAIAYRAVSAFTVPEQREALGELLKALGELGLTESGEQRARWRRMELRLDQAVITASHRSPRRDTWRALLPLEEGAFLAFLDYSYDNGDVNFPVLFHDPSGRFDVPAPYEVLSSGPLTLEETALPSGLLEEAAARGPAPWFPEAAEEFARLTGVTATTAKLVVAGLPRVDTWERSFLPAEVRRALGVKVAEADLAKDELRKLPAEVRQAVVGALVPAEPSRLWTDGPDAAAAAEVWNARVGRSAAVPEALLAEMRKALRTGRSADTLRSLLDPRSSLDLTRDVQWTVRNHRIVPAGGKAAGFTSSVLVSSVAAAAWLAHRLPAGDPLRAGLPAALALIRERLAAPELMLVLSRYVDRHAFRRAAGAPTETGEGYERYGAVVLPTTDHPYPAIKMALLDEAGEDPYLPVLRGGSAPTGVETALRLVRDRRFEALLADPGDPVAGERNADGTWWPQDPSRSVPDLVVEASELYGLSSDAAIVYLMLLAMPDPTDKHTARWTGWKPARLKAACVELAATDLVVEARRSRAGRSLFLPGGWNAVRAPHPPQEEWKLPLYGLEAGASQPPLGVLVPAEPVADLYRRAWWRVTEGDVPRFTDLEVPRVRRR
ncbi:DNA-binding protein [Actinocorallia sp. B10E7]|uniref:DNA-binding protein n=1 Tax=Actinocorallia sp. B10E7 TaxID=3153558 RepID=UPI00325EACCC